MVDENLTPFEREEKRYEIEKVLKTHEIVYNVLTARIRMDYRKPRAQYDTMIRICKDKGDEKLEKHFRDRLRLLDEHEKAELEKINKSYEKTKKYLRDYLKKLTIENRPFAN